MPERAPVAERDVVRAILLGTSHLVDWLRNPVGVAERDGRVIRYGAGGVGASDLLGVRRSDGRFVACEVKAPNGHVRPEQVQFLERMRRSHAIAFVARSVEDVLDAVGG